MIGVKLANNARTTLPASITSDALVFSIATADQTKFPSPGENEWFPITVVDIDGNMEIMRVTARTGALLTVLRGQEGTTARAFASGSRVELRLTTAAMLEIISALNDMVVGTSGDVIPKMGQVNEWSGLQKFMAGIGFGNNDTATFNDTTNTLLLQADGGAAEMILQVDRLRLTAINGASPTSLGHGLQIGPAGGEHLKLDTGEILALNGEAGVKLLVRNGVRFENGVMLAVADGGTGGTTASEAMAVLGAGRTVSAGNGLTGGGTLAANRSIAMGTPGTLDNTTTNQATETSHFHNVNFAGGIASMGAGSVGSYALLGIYGATRASLTQGDTIAGSQLEFSGYYGANGTNSNFEVASKTGGSPSGTWRCMGRFQNTDGSSGSGTLFLRIS